MIIADIQKIENNREDAASRSRIHFVKDGNFYRAHDISAWLITTHPFGEAIKNIKPVAKQLKDGYIDVFIGFPLTSIDKFIPNDGSVTFESINDMQFDVIVKLADDVATAPFDEIRRTVDEWKQSLPMSEDKPARRKDREVAIQQPRITRISDVISRVLSFPLEDSSPMDAYNFLRELRRDIVAIF